MLLPKEELKIAISDFNPKEFTDSELQIDCPECRHRECYISIKEKNHPYGCFRQSKCGTTGNIYSLSKYGIKIGNKYKVTSPEFKKKSLEVFETENEEIILQEIRKPIGYKRVYSDSYLASRGFSEIDFDYWEVGRVPFGSLKNYVIFPIYQNSIQVAHVARIVTSGEPKYRNSVSDFHSILGNHDRIINHKTVILCEGYFDIVNITRLLGLYEDSNLIAVCTFGAKISANQIQLFKNKNIKNIILMYDSDVIKKIKKIAFELSLYFNVKITIIEGDKIDAGDCDLEALNKALSTTKTPIEFFLNRL